MTAIAIFAAQSAWSNALDPEVIVAVLSHFSARTDSSSAREDGITLVQAKTHPWTIDGLRGFSLIDRKGQCDITTDMYMQLRKRNSSSESAATLLLPSRMWRPLKAEDDKRQRRFGLPEKTASGELVKTIIQLSNPGYSTNEDTAFVIFFFKWSVHSAIAQYIAQRTPTGWKVQCSELIFYP